MATEATLFDFINTGVLGDAGEILSAGVIYFYEPGTTTAKNAYTEKEKTNAIQSLTLDADGRGVAYGDGTYKIVVKDSDGAEVFTLDAYKVGSDVGGGSLGVTVITSTTQPQLTVGYDGSNKVTLTTTSDGDVTLDATGGTVTLDDDVGITGDLDVTGDTILGGGLDVTGNADLDGTLGVHGDAIMYSALSVTGDFVTANSAVISKTLQAREISVGSINVTSDVTIGGDLNVTGDISGVSGLPSSIDFTELTGAYFSGWSAGSNYSPGGIYYAKVGGWLYLYIGAITLNSASPTTSIATLPAGYRPDIKFHLGYAQFTRDTGQTWIAYKVGLSLDTNGVIQVSGDVADYVTPSYGLTTNLVAGSYYLLTLPAFHMVPLSTTGI